VNAISHCADDNEPWRQPIRAAPPSCAWKRFFENGGKPRSEALFRNRHLHPPGFTDMANLMGRSASSSRQHVEMPFEELLRIWPLPSSPVESAVPLTTGLGTDFQVQAAGSRRGVRRSHVWFRSHRQYQQISMYSTVSPREKPVARYLTLKPYADLPVVSAWRNTDKGPSASGPVRPNIEDSSQEGHTNGSWILKITG